MAFFSTTLFAYLKYKCRSVCVPLFFGVILLFGLCIYKDYGISWDEPIQRYTGMVTLNYLNERLDLDINTSFNGSDHVTPLSQYTDRDYGVAFELPMSLIETLFDLNEREAYDFRHLATFLVFFLGSIAVYRLAERRFSDWRIGLLTTLCLILSPRFFAESFYNDKDIVFMALFAIAMNTTIAFVLDPRIRTALANSLATAIAIDVRIMAVILPLLALLILMLRFLRREISLKITLSAATVCIGATFAFAVAFWPWLWDAPLQNFF